MSRPVMLLLATLSTRKRLELQEDDASCCLLQPTSCQRAPAWFETSKFEACAFLPAATCFGLRPLAKAVPFPNRPRRRRETVAGLIGLGP
jgi:hypothetical protein